MAAPCLPYHTTATRAFAYDNGKQAFSNGTPSLVDLSDGGATNPTTALCVSEMTYSQSSGLASFYNNGVANGTVTSSSTAVTNGLSIGSLLNYGSWYSWNGNISEVIIFNRVLTSTEIQSVQLS
jgi:hypothetical protein